MQTVFQKNQATAVNNSMRDEILAFSNYSQHFNPHKNKSNHHHSTRSNPMDNNNRYKEKNKWCKMADAYSFYPNQQQQLLQLRVKQGRSVGVNRNHIGIGGTYNSRDQRSLDNRGRFNNRAESALVQHEQAAHETQPELITISHYPKEQQRQGSRRVRTANRPSRNIRIRSTQQRSVGRGKSNLRIQDFGAGGHSSGFQTTLASTTLSQHPL